MCDLNMDTVTILVRFKHYRPEDTFQGKAKEVQVYDQFCHRATIHRNPIVAMVLFIVHYSLESRCRHTRLSRF
jgi:hypothetical protein